VYTNIEENMKGTEIINISDNEEKGYMELRRVGLWKTSRSAFIEGYQIKGSRSSKREILLYFVL
jgi:hypothetical protein